MLTVTQLEHSEATLKEVGVVRDNLSTVLTYNPHLKTFSNERHVRIWTALNMVELEKALTGHPLARIILVIDHDPILTHRMKMMIRNSETTINLIANIQRIQGYIDDFGRYVYIQPFLDLDASLTDIDRRYEGVDNAPEEVINTDEYDICSWPSTSKSSLRLPQISRVR